MSVRMMLRILSLAVQRRFEHGKAEAEAAAGHENAEAEDDTANC